MKDETLHAAFQNWEVLSNTPEEFKSYEARLKRVLDDEAAVREAELREIEARREGMQEGLQKGLQKGLQTAMEATAVQMLTEGFDVETVSRLSGLHADQVSKIQKEMLQ